MGGCVAFDGWSVGRWVLNWVDRPGAGGTAARAGGPGYGWVGGVFMLIRTLRGTDVLLHANKVHHKVEKWRRECTLVRRRIWRRCIILNFSWWYRRYLRLAFSVLVSRTQSKSRSGRIEFSVHEHVRLFNKKIGIYYFVVVIKILPSSTH